MERGGGAMMTLLSPPADLGGAGMKLTVDAASCCMGHGRCYTLAPDLLEDDDDEGYVSVRGQVIDVPGRPGRRTRATRRARARSARSAFIDD